MSARKIRMTTVGLIAMPADRDEALVSADDIPGDPELRTAFAELLPWSEETDEAALKRAEDAPTYEPFEQYTNDAERLSAAWDEALDAAGANDLAGLRAALTRARDTAIAAGLSTVHEDAALAMLPEDAS